MKIKEAVIVLLGLVISACSGQEELSFSICTDVHADIIHDEIDRIGTFVKAASDAEDDFIIDLGDFCMPKRENDEFYSVWSSFEGKKFHALGNHDMDINSKDRYLDYTSTIHNYYSFDIKNYHFIVLDPNYFETDSGFVDYDNGNYYAHGEKRCNIPPEQLEWLKKDLAKNSTPTIVFSHQGLLAKGAVRNREEVRKILEDSGRVIAAFSGHQHRDIHQEINGIHYIILNSMSDIWVGDKYKYEARFSKEINEANPSLKYTIPFKDPLFAQVSIGKGKISVKGRTSEFIPPTPEDLGVVRDIKPTANISDRVLSFNY